jgi:hypothetical protein
VVFVLVIAYLFKLLKNNKKELLNSLGIFIATLFISGTALFSYILIDWHGFWIRTSEISIFSRNYPPVEFVKELGANMYRAAAIPWIGDPNAGKNPSGVPLFDPITITLAIFGLIILFKKQKTIFFAALLFLLPPFLSDIFSTEVIPEFHYYGLGHPNALRVSGYIGVVLFLAVWSVDKIWGSWKKENYGIYISVILLAVISFWNYHLYFNQKSVHPTFYIYNYRVNNQHVLEAISYLNQTNYRKIYVTNHLMALEMTPFFLNREKSLNKFEPKDHEGIINTVRRSDATLVDVNNDTLTHLQKILDEALIGEGYTARLVRDPTNQPMLVIFEKI